MTRAQAEDCKVYKICTFTLAHVANLREVLIHQILFTPDESSLEGGPTVIEGGGGGLGEEMFRYSSAFVLARRTGQRACVPKVHSHNGAVNGAVIN